MAGVKKKPVNKADAVIAQLSERGLQLSLDPQDDALLVKGLTGSMTTEARESIQMYRPEIVAALRERTHHTVNVAEPEQELGQLKAILPDTAEPETAPCLRPWDNGAQAAAIVRAIIPVQQAIDKLNRIATQDTQMLNAVFQHQDAEAIEAAVLGYQRQYAWLLDEVNSEAEPYRPLEFTDYIPIDGIEAEAAVEGEATDGGL